MTYYGRWTYKFEEAARQGAAAALIIHDTEGAVLRLGRGEEHLERRAVRPARRATIRRRACRCRAGSPATPRSRCSPTPGLDLDELRTGRRQARLQGRCRCKAKASRRPARARSARSPRATWSRCCRAAKRPDEAIVYMAHWDHLGNARSRRARARGDTRSTTARSTTRPAWPASSRSPKRSASRSRRRSARCCSWR